MIYLVTSCFNWPELTPLAEIKRAAAHFCLEASPSSNATETRLRDAAAPERNHPMFELLQPDPDSKARRGPLTTAHGVIETPAMPVGTQGEGCEGLVSESRSFFLSPSMFPGVGMAT